MANLITGQTHHYGLGEAEVRPVANLIRLRKTHHYGLGGSPHDRAAVVSPGDKTLDRVAFIVSRLCRKGLNIF
ncbi:MULTISPECIES: hypothetical protein [Moorena]|uniref:hypothetical protein n=1 Tax=Moorena TaxID=1155738 RepID=UPI0012B55A82|nr:MULTISPECIES: hypothetical protein [Moorena]NEP33517.1 hypothetical protein [Moorena sp. SIO3B2]NEP67798.1 hypothetical protein [Moorena sp. SIO3A5]NER90218.1 hypothetical protein [Moorena sp. SIO3A2]NES42860.1 hypothetical protein [Moorena sp. SIO2C4]NET65500.1 hypothetical protein [Moorena sp. SIO1G6]